MSLNDEIMAAKAISESLAALNDPELISDSVEGETNLFEIFDKLLEANLNDASLICGIDEYLVKLEARKSGAKNRIETRRALIAQALDISNITTSIRRPLGTLSYEKGRQEIKVIDESALPSRFFIQQPNKLDKKALNEAVKSGEVFEGVVLTNGAPILKIRT